MGDAWITLTQAVEPHRVGRVIATISDSTLFAEGIDADVTTGMLYVASVKHRTIVEVRLLFVLRSGSDTLEVVRSPLFRSLQGVAEIPTRHQLVVADYSHGLLRVDLRTRVVTRIADAAGSTSLGVDGIVWDNGSSVGVQNGIEPARIVSFTLDDSLTRISRVSLLDRQADVADEPTIGTVWRGGFAYVANSQWGKYDHNGKRGTGTSLRPTYLIHVPSAKRERPRH